MSDIRPYPPWWQPRFDDLDDLDLAYEEAEPPTRSSWFNDVDEPRIDSYWDELHERDDQR